MKRDLELEATMVEKFVAVESVLDERSRRLWAAAESRAIGYGGDAVVSAATGLARTTIRLGRREIESGVEDGRLMRRPGAGRPSIESSQPGVKAGLEKLVDPLTRGDPCSPLRWTCKSRARLTGALVKAGWQGKTLRSFQTIVDSIGNTRTGAGLRVKAKLDKRTYPTGVKIPAAEMKALSLHRLDFQGEWNYELHARSSARALGV